MDKPSRPLSLASEPTVPADIETDADAGPALAAPGRLHAVLVPAALAAAGVAAVAGARVRDAGPDSPTREALARVASGPGDPGAWRELSTHLAVALEGAGPALGAIALAAANLAFWLLVRSARAHRATGGSPGGTGIAVPAAETPDARGAFTAPAPIVSSRRAPPEASPDDERALRARLDVAQSEVDRLRGELAVHVRQLEAMRAARSRFLARMSHALRTPLNGILGMAEMIGAGELDDERRRCAERLTNATQNLLGVVNGTLDHALIATGELRLQRSRFALHESIEEGCQRRGVEAHARGVELVCYIDEEVPRDVDGDGNRLWQVIDALVTNAIEHTERGEVVVRVVRDGPAGGAGAEPGEGEGGAGCGATRSRYRCDVQDTGSGLSPECQLRLWNAFRGPVADASPSPDADGKNDVLGLGLYTASELARRMGGGLDVRSRLGEGSRFSFTFELGDVEGADVRPAAPRALRGARAFVVDDNETNRTILSHQLGNWGVHVTCADGGPAALAALRGARDAGVTQDVLVLDLHMPGMDGLELARRIVADPALGGVPILMLTSSQIDLDAAELDALGIERNLTKPARQSVLHDTLASMVRTSKGHGARGPVAVAPAVKAAATSSEKAASAAAPDPGPAARADRTAQRLDLAAIDEIRALERPERPDLLGRVVDVWRARAPELVDVMRTALADRDRAALLDAVHELKSSSEYLGAAAVAACCREVETALGGPLEERIDELGELVDALDAEREAVGDALTRLVSRAA